MLNARYYFHRRLQLEYRSTFFNLLIFYCSFAFFRRCLDAEMKDSTRQGVSLQTKKEKKEAVKDEDEEKFWSAGLFGSGRAKQLLDNIYFYNRKMFGVVNKKAELAV